MKIFAVFLALFVAQAAYGAAPILQQASHQRRPGELLSPIEYENVVCVGDLLEQTGVTLRSLQLSGIVGIRSGYFQGMRYAYVLKLEAESLNCITVGYFLNNEWASEEVGLGSLFLLPKFVQGERVDPRAETRSELVLRLKNVSAVPQSGVLADAGMVINPFASDDGEGRNCLPLVATRDQHDLWEGIKRDAHEFVSAFFESIGSVFVCGSDDLT